MRNVKPFGGAKTCEPCHTEIYAKWGETKHAHGFDVLVDAGRELDRDCTPCHVAGFHELGGFVNAIESPHLTGIQCESCHGNGHDHLKDPTVPPPTDAKAVCTELPHQGPDPDFDFSSFWEQGGH